MSMIRIDSEHETILKAVAREAECSKEHAVKWAIRTLADKRGIKFPSSSRIQNQSDCKRSAVAL